MAAKTEKNSNATKPDARNERLKSALKANLKRRKAQARARADKKQETD